MTPSRRTTDRLAIQSSQLTAWAVGTRSIWEMSVWKYPTVLEAIDRVKSTALAANMPVGMAGTSDPETAIGWLRQGFQFATLGNTNGMLMRSSRDFVDSVRRGVSEE